MKTIPELITENPIGTLFDTEKELPEASSCTKMMLGAKFRSVGIIQIIECEDGTLMTLKSYASDFDPSRLEEDEDIEEDEDW